MPTNVDAFITMLRSGSGDPGSLLDQLEGLEAAGPASHTPLGRRRFTAGLSWPRGCSSAARS